MSIKTDELMKADILIFAGQSNMQGQSETLSEQEIVARTWEYRFLTDTLVPLQNPVGENIRSDGSEGTPSTQTTDLSEWLRENTLGAAWCSCTNMVPSFCRAYNKKTGKQIVAVHAAKGSTRVGDWLPGTDGYRMLRNKSLAAIAKTDAVYGVDHVFVVWLQGESDAMAGCSKEEYMIRLKQLKEALKQEIGMTRFCVIRVGRFTNDERDLAVMDAQSELCREDADFVMLTEQAAFLCEDPRNMNPFVGGHFSASGLEQLGGIAGAALADSISVLLTV